MDQGLQQAVRTLRSWAIEMSEAEKKASLYIPGRVYIYGERIYTIEEGALEQCFRDILRHGVEGVKALLYVLDAVEDQVTENTKTVLELTVVRCADVFCQDGIAEEDIPKEYRKLYSQMMEMILQAAFMAGGRGSLHVSG